MSEEVDLEELDPLMNGQTHRAHLNAFVQENGGQVYGKASASTRGISRIRKPAGFAGRGAAMASTRGRAGIPT